jgi:DNA polymerase-3 subunit delta'
MQTTEITQTTQSTERAALPAVFDGIAAQDGALRVLQHALQKDRVAHAYLFEGPSGVGKERAAIALACALLCAKARAGESCACNGCERVRAGKHPDVRVFRPRDEGDRNLQVELIRTELLPFTKFAPFEAEAACVIFPEADVSFPIHHAEAANALLKTLEEPRPRVTFLLLSERPDRLLPTIRSRCQRVRFRPLPSSTLASIMASHDIPEAVRAPAVALSQGRADRALALSADNLVEKLVDFVLRVDEAVASAKPGDLLDLAHELADNDQLELLLSALSLFYRDVAHIALQTPEPNLSFPHLMSALTARAQSLGALACAERVAAIAAAGEAIDRNANAEIALDALLFGFATGKFEPIKLVAPKPRRR